MGLNGGDTEETFATDSSSGYGSTPDFGEDGEVDGVFLDDFDSRYGSSADVLVGVTRRDGAAAPVFDRSSGASANGTSANGGVFDGVEGGEGGTCDLNHSCFATVDVGIFSLSPSLSLLK